MSLDLLFEQIMTIRKTSKIPIILMGYLNPVLAFGMRKFLDACMRADIDSVILPDLPLETYLREYEAMFKARDLGIVFLANPLTNPNRLAKIMETSVPFVYYMASTSTTGKAENYSVDQMNDFAAIKQQFSNQKIMLGFGIYNAYNLAVANDYFSGGIVGSAFIRKQTNQHEAIEFIRSLSSLTYG